MSADNDSPTTMVPVTVRKVIDKERRTLMRASSLLACLRAATLHEEEIDVADVVEVAICLVDEAVDSLDSVNLDRAAKAVEMNEGR